MDDELEKLLDKPILEQMYGFRKESFQQRVYENCQEIKDIESNVYDLKENFTKFLREVIKDKENYKNAIDKFKEYTNVFNEQVDFWNFEFFKLGMLDKEKVKNEFLKGKVNLEESDSFLDSEKNILEYVEEQKKKYVFDTEEYKKLKQEYIKIVKTYPKVAEVYQDLEPKELNKDEIKALCKLRKIDIDMGYIELKLSFKLGMKEVINL